MPDIADRLKRYIDRYTIKNDIRFVVDMGSLEHIIEQLTMIDNKNIGIINNVSTRLTLNIVYAGSGYGIVIKERRQSILQVPIHL